MAKLSLENVVQRSNQILTTAISGETVMMDIQSSMYFGLNDVGTEVWSRLEHAKPVGQLVKELQEIFDGDANEMTSDVLELLESLQARKLLTVLS